MAKSSKVISGPSVDIKMPSQTSSKRGTSTNGVDSPSASKRGPSGKFIGETKGNRDLPINRSSGVSTGHGGRGNRC